MKYLFVFNFFFFSLFLFFVLGNVPIAEAGDISSSHFIVRDPVIGTGGGYGSSGSFQFFGAGNPSFSQVGSSGSFLGHYGFLYYPGTTVTPTPTPTPGGGGGGIPVNLCRIADLNCDGAVNLLDLSILLYFTDHQEQKITQYDLNADGKLTLMDISVMFYYWDNS
jgi:hypothetical protein